MLRKSSHTVESITTHVFMPSDEFLGLGAGTPASNWPKSGADPQSDSLSLTQFFVTCWCSLDPDPECDERTNLKQVLTFLVIYNR